MTAAALAAPGYSRPLNRRARITSTIMYLLCCACAAIAILVLVSLIGYVLYRGLSALSWSLFANNPFDTPGGMRNCIAGTLLLICTSSCLGVPVGMLCGIYLAEFARDNFFSRTIRTTVDVLAGTPSVIVGVLAYQLVVRPMGHPSGWAGTVALGFVMCPIIARTTEEMLRLVPQAYREASVGVGASKFQTLVRVVLPAARSGIITGVMLAVARIAGETAPLVFTTNFSNLPLFEFTGPHAPSIHFNQDYPTMTVWIYENATSQRNDWVAAAWAGMVVLIALIMILNLAVRHFSKRHR